MNPPKRTSYWACMPAALAILCVILLSASLRAEPAAGRIAGRVVDPQGAPVAQADVKLVNAAGITVGDARSDEQGRFALTGVDSGDYQLIAESPGFVTVVQNVFLGRGQQPQVSLQFQQLVSVQQQVTVVASAPSVLTPDPAQSIIIHDQVLDANPGRPGAPISIPGLPIETASGGIKAPQYFAPGVAGDHGEPIAQFFQIGNFLYPNNLPANAHGNGYADPNVLIPPVIEGVTVDGGAFNVREGNNSVDLAAAYVPRQRVGSFFQLTGDYRDADVMAGWSPKNPQTNAWIAAELSFGNGFLERLEHRQQYKLNGLRQFNFGNHQLTLFGIGYYGSSYVPGLIPINVPVPGDTIDNRQLDYTHNVLLVATDNWKLSEQKQLSFSGFYRDYGLDLRSNFGDGLIQQSETRNVFGGEALYIQSVRRWLALLAGVDVRRDAPRNLDLQHADAQGNFQLVTSNNLTMSFVEPFLSVDGPVGRYFHYNLGVRQEEVWMDNEDLINPQNSFNKLATLTLPKGTFTVLPPDRWYLPMVSFSLGEAFHTEDPRIGNGTGTPTLLAPSRAYQFVFSKVIKQTQLYVTLRRISNSQELAKIDPDTGLQELVGPSLNKVLSVSLQRNFAHGSLYASYAQADARDAQTGEPIPEAPRFIWDTVASYRRLPFGLWVRGEFEYVRAKPLGDGFTGVPVTEFRGAVLKPFREETMSLAANFLIANGYTGQTTEVLALPTDPAPFERVVGVPLKSYVSLSWTYYFGRGK
jgi:Carboxypeptidase regulatory-like domain